MAYMTQEMKKDLSPAIKAVLKNNNLKGSISVRNHSTLIVTIKSGKFDFENEMVNGQVWNRDSNVPNAAYKAIINEIKDAMNVGNYDNSDIMTDYFDVGFYTDVRVGAWDKPYVYTGK
jgi:hypothetical protein